VERPRGVFPPFSSFKRRFKNTQIGSNTRNGRLTNTH
jgi:hypothetical protein